MSYYQFTTNALRVGLIQALGLIMEGSMEFKQVTTQFGQTFKVPSWIQRLDFGATHGWQLRYGEWILFSDHSNDGKGSRKSLSQAKEELKKRMKSIPGPSRIKVQTARFKSSDLPVGISGPIERVRNRSAIIQYYFGVSIPRFGNTSTNRSIYIATENTYSDERYNKALQKAISVRNMAVQEFNRLHQANRKKEADRL